MTTSDFSKKSNEILAEIQTVLASIDGIATSDSFKLGQLVRDYADAKVSGAISEIMSLMASGMKEKKPKQPWES